MLYPISVPKPNSTEDLVGFINAEGSMVVPPSYVAASYAFEGKSSVVCEGGKSGFIDQVGNVVIPCRFKGLGRFKDGLCSINGGFIQHSGDWIVEPRFLVAGDFSEGRAFASTDGEMFGFIDLNGEFVIRAEFQQCRQFSGGLAAVLQEGRWGYIDNRGEIKIPLVFEGPRAQAFRNGVAAVQLDGRWGFIDDGGSFVVKPQYEDLRSFAEGYAPVQRRRKWGLINADGKSTA